MDYHVRITEEARREIHNLPGNMRQRILKALHELEKQPRPTTSRPLDIRKIPIEITELEPRRIRLGSWRILYVIEGTEGTITVLAVRKRPPYQYKDLETLIKNL